MEETVILLPPPLNLLHGPVYVTSFVLTTLLSVKDAGVDAAHDVSAEMQNVAGVQPVGAKGRRGRSGRRYSTVVPNKLRRSQQLSARWNPASEEAESEDARGCG